MSGRFLPKTLHRWEITKYLVSPLECLNSLTYYNYQPPHVCYSPNLGSVRAHMSWILSRLQIKWVKCLPGGIQNGCLENGSRWSSDIKPNMVRDKILNLRGLWGRWPGQYQTIKSPNGLYTHKLFMWRRQVRRCCILCESQVSFNTLTFHVNTSFLLQTPGSAHMLSC